MNKILPLLLLFTVQICMAQYDHESVFPDLEGESLRSALISEYKTNSVLTYGEARDTFMRNIDAVDNVLECVYTGYKVTLNPTLDPTADAFSQGINTEHTYPRSKGASEGTNAYSDMHHLFPTRERANADRGSLIFADIPDNQTDKWYFEENITTNVPNANVIDNYSELLTNEGFEPREAHKGDVARAYFYFYTMYKSQADIAAPNFFELQRESMCEWHYADPVDEKEWNRNIKIASYQDDKKNPFILDCRLARLYCTDVSAECTAVNSSDVEIQKLLSYPNPAANRLYFDHTNDAITQYSIYSVTGHLHVTGYLSDVANGKMADIRNLSKGMYIISLQSYDGVIHAQSKFIKL